MGSRPDVFQDDCFEIAAGDAAEVKEDVVAELGEVLENCQRPRNVGTAITDEDGFLDSLHSASQASGGSGATDYNKVPASAVRQPRENRCRRSAAHKNFPLYPGLTPRAKFAPAAARVG